MKQNYGRQILGTKINKGLSDFGTNFIISLILSIAITCAAIHILFPYGLLDYADFVWQKFSLTFKVEYLPTVFHNAKFSRPSMDDVEFYKKINEYWDLNYAKNRIYCFIFILSFLVSMVSSYKFFKRFGEKEQERRYERDDELRLVNNKELIKEIKSEVKRKNNDTEFTLEDLFFGKNQIRVPFGLLSTHVGFGGASKTGKTNGMNEMLIQDRKLKSKCLIVDPRGQFFAKHGRKNDKILSLFDIRQEKWDFWCEKIAFKFLADALVEVKESSNNNKFFDKSGREVLAAALRHTKSLEELWEVVNYNMKSLHDFLVDHNELSKQLLSEGAGAQSAGIIATSILNMGFIKSMNHHVCEREKLAGKEEKCFSLTEWVNNDEDESWIFIIDDIRNLTEAQPLHRLWFDIVTSSAYDRDVNRPNLKQINLYCDEITTVGNLPTLPSVLDKGRNFRLRLIIGFQSYAQLELIYGKDVAVNIFQGLQTIFCFASNSEVEARLFADRMGKSVIIEADQSLGLNSKSNNANISYRTREIYNVTPSQIQALKDNMCFAKIARVNPSKIEFKYHKMPTINEGSKSIIPPKTRFDGIKTNQYESEALKKEREENKSKEMKNPKIMEMNSFVKSIVEEAIVLLTENSDSSKIEKMGNKILERFGSSQGIKAKIGENIYSITIHKPSKTIYLNTNEFEFSIPFPKIKVLIEGKDEAQEASQNIEEIENKERNLSTDNKKQNEQIQSKSPFISIPIKIKKQTVEKDLPNKNELGL
jgi:hypothetical protein